MVGDIILYTILFLLLSLLMGIFFCMLFTAHQDMVEKGSTVGKFLLDIFVIVCMYFSYLLFDAMWFQPHNDLCEYRGTKNGESTYVTYNLFFTDSAYVKAQAVDTITATVIEFPQGECGNHIHAKLKCSDGYEITNEPLYNIKLNQAKGKKYKVKREYFPDKKYTLIQ